MERSVAATTGPRRTRPAELARGPITERTSAYHHPEPTTGHDVQDLRTPGTYVHHQCHHPAQRNWHRTRGPPVLPTTPSDVPHDACRNISATCRLTRLKSSGLKIFEADFGLLHDRNIIAGS